MKQESKVDEGSRTFQVEGTTCAKALSWPGVRRAAPCAWRAVLMDSVGRELGGTQGARPQRESGRHSEVRARRGRLPPAF